MIYLDVRHLLRITERVVGAVEVRDIGLLESAAARPQTTVFGEDAYATLYEKAAALTHSIAKNHALVDGNKRLALGACIALLGLNGCVLTMSEDLAYDFIMAIASGEVDDVADITDRLTSGTRMTQIYDGG